MFRILMTTALLFATPALAQDAVKLKPGAELDTVTTVCSICHTLNYIRMNSPFLTPDAWKAEVTKMQKVLGGPFDDDTAASITRYLAANYAAAPKP
jgi:hypothetical protein